LSEQASAMAAYGEKGATASAAEKEMMTVEKTITLISDGQERKRFEVSEAAAARLSSVLGGMIYGGSTAGGIPVPIGGATLATVAEYLNRHDETDDDEYGYTAAFEGPETLGDELVDRLGEEQEALFNLIDATNFLCIIGLLDAACKKVADMMKGKTPKQIRTIFNIPDDYTKEEKKELRREYAWAFFPKYASSSSSSSADDDEERDGDKVGDKDKGGDKDVEYEDYGDEDDVCKEEEEQEPEP
jgi:S-phase kinase-associated protein 1